MAADFSHRSQSVDDSDINNGPSSLPPFSTNSNETTSNNLNNGNCNGSNNNNQNNQEPVSLPENGFHRAEHAENGNDKDSSDGQNVSTSDRRKLFERSQSVQETGTSATPVTSTTNGTSNSQTAKKTRISVAERLKMYQQNAGNGAVHEEENGKGDTTAEMDIEQKKDPMQTSQIITSNTKESRSEREFCPAPISKPERKFTPPKQEPVKIQESSQPKAPSHKRIDTVFGKLPNKLNYVIIQNDS